MILLYVLPLFFSCASVREKPDVVQETETDDSMLPSESDAGKPDQEPAATPVPVDQIEPMGEAYRHFFRGVYFENRDNLETAIEEYRKSLELTTHSPYLAVKIAVLYDERDVM